MSRFLLLLLVSMVVAVGCSRTKPIEEVAKEPEVPVNTVGDLVVGQPIRHANLTIFPVSSRELRSDDRFITLNEGLAAGTVEIVEVGSAAENSANQPARGNQAPRANRSFDSPFQHEDVTPSGRQAADDDNPFDDNPDGIVDQEFDDPLGDNNPFGNDVVTTGNQNDSPRQGQGQGQGQGLGGAEVNRLMVINRSEKPLYLMPGEVIVGGRQDRTIGSEIVIQPTGKPVPIDAFCVEQGRWASRDGAQFLALVQSATLTVERRASVVLSDGVDAENAAEQAKRGKFIASIGNLSKESRLAVNQSSKQGEGQGEVWDTIAKGNAIAGVAWSSGAFTANYTEEEAVARLDPYIAQLQKPIAERDKIVGVIVAINGEVHSMDIFESTPLFQKLWPKLLKSYALDAANAAEPNVAQLLLCPTTTACDFLREATEGKAETTVKGEIVMTRRSTENLESFTASHGAAASEDIMGFGGNASGVHTSAFSK
ncbi:MAG: hypothetical protein IIA67_13890 [Planctomycetes bacterium]|nr:hypothetical protein [Planctomycetota bacterium]